jgi:hypothetical protein
VKLDYSNGETHGGTRVRVRVDSRSHAGVSALADGLLRRPQRSMSGSDQGAAPDHQSGSPLDNQSRHRPMTRFRPL